LEDAATQPVDGRHQATPWVVTEFEEAVPWAGASQTIAAAAGHHFMEGRWLRNSSYLDSYARFWMGGGGDPRSYTFWVASALYQRYKVNGDAALLLELRGALVANYDAWVRTHTSTEHDCAWQYADRDGQEHSIGGDGCRPLLNSALVGEATALAAIATLAADEPSALRFRREADRWRRALLSLWSPSLQFFETDFAKSNRQSLALSFHACWQRLALDLITHRVSLSPPCPT